MKDLLRRLFPTYFRIMSASDTCRQSPADLILDEAAKLRSSNEMLKKVIEDQGSTATEEGGGPDGRPGQRRRTRPGHLRLLP